MFPKKALFGLAMVAVRDLLVGFWIAEVPRSFRVITGNKRDTQWKAQSYTPPPASRKRIQWKATAFRGLELLTRHTAEQPATIVVPALYSFKPGEMVALGWLNDVQALGRIRQRIVAASNLTGWDVFTFHTLHNLDRYFDSTIAAMRDTWLNERNLNADCVSRTEQQFRRPYDYHEIRARLVENLTLQTSLLDWLCDNEADVSFRVHVIGTGLMSALVWAGAITFPFAVNSLTKIGAHWDRGLISAAEEELKAAKLNPDEDSVGWSKFFEVRRIIEGRNRGPRNLSLVALREHLPQSNAPSRPFWYSSAAGAKPVLIQTARDVQKALQSMNLNSWSPGMPERLLGERLRGWLVSSLHPMASVCRWSVSNYLLATPQATTLFLNHIATLGRPWPNAEIPASSKSLATVQNKGDGALIN